jgi:D-amino-acid oxidase
MHRRTFLSTGGLAALGFAVQGCATRSRAGAGDRIARLRLPVVRASWDRVIRTTVGLRPHRDGGFVVRADKQDDKVLVQLGRSVAQ